MGRIEYQKSAGGVVVQGRSVLLIQTETKSGRLVWTLPKGRIEPLEKPWEAALRELREETGYLCRLRQRLRITSYTFRSETSLVRKTVLWYWMEPLRKAGEHNPREVRSVAWYPFSDVYQRLTYRSDFRLIRHVENLVSPMPTP